MRNVVPVILGIAVTLVFFYFTESSPGKLALADSNDQLSAALDSLSTIAGIQTPRSAGAPQDIARAEDLSALVSQSPRISVPGASVTVAPKVPPNRPKFGFYLPVFNQVPSVLGVLKSTRKHYPEAPIYVLQDGGKINFGPICKTPAYLCIFERAVGENSRWNPHSWFARMVRAAHVLGTEYLIYLEPDVKIAKRHSIDPKHDAGGLYDNFNPAMHQETRTYLEGLGRERNPCFKVTWPHFGLAGGSYFRVEALLDAFAPEHLKRLDWRGLESKEGDKTTSSDFAMIVALYARGWHVYPWEESAQNFKHRGLPKTEAERQQFRKTWPAYNPDAAFTHDHKEHYSDTVSAKEQALIQHFADMWPNLDCHGCVWYKNADPATPLKKPGSSPKVPDQYRFRPNQIKHTHKACTKAQLGQLTTPAPSRARSIATLGHGPQGAAQEAVADAALPTLPARVAQLPAAPMPTIAESPVVVAPVPASTKAPTYILNADKFGLPIAPGPRPAWLIKNDELVIDARPQQQGGVLILQPVLMDASGDWGRKQSQRPRWLRAILATNRNHARKYGHAVILRWNPTQPQLTAWQKRQCGSKTSEKSCTKTNERENFNWEKHMMLYEYLLSPQNFTHILMLDADAALVKHSIDILGGIAKQMETRNLDVFLTSEDWLLNGENRINGGLIMARNTLWTQNLFQDTFAAHIKGPAGLKRWRIGVRDMQCSSNEQICLNDLMQGGYKEKIRQHMTLESGVIYNRGGCVIRHCGEPITDKKMEELRMKDERLQVLHFMGGSKGLAPEALCESGYDYTGDGPTGYGCKK